MCYIHCTDYIQIVYIRIYIIKGFVMQKNLQSCWGMHPEAHRFHPDFLAGETPQDLSTKKKWSYPTTPKKTK